MTWYFSFINSFIKVKRYKQKLQMIKIDFPLEISKIMQSSISFFKIWFYTREFKSIVLYTHALYKGILFVDYIFSLAFKII